MIFLPKAPYMHRIFMALANPINEVRSVQSRMALAQHTLLAG